jgi:hypothetical protein
MRNFRNYNKEEIFKNIDQISIEKNKQNQVITKFGGRVINITNVSNRYEIFDIVKYLKDKIELIEKNFEISKYRLKITNGQQYLQLISDKVEVGGVEFYKSFYILNSTDKSRRLSFNVGLYSHSSNFYMIGANNVGLTKKHLTGVTKAAEDASEGLNGESFDEQIESLRSLVGHRIQLSKLRQVILGDKEDVPQINHRKFDAFKNSIRFAASDGLIKITTEQRHQLFTESEKMTTIQHDFYIDAFWAFQVYLRLFNKQDSHIIKNETDRIMKMTQWAVRNNVLEALGI